MKAWSSSSRIIRDTENHEVKRWLPSTGFTPEGRVVNLPPAPLVKTGVSSSSPSRTKVEAPPPPSSPPLQPSSSVVIESIVVPPEASPVSTVSAMLTPEEEGLLSVAALRLLPDELENLRLQAFKEGDTEGYQRGLAEGRATAVREVEETMPARLKAQLEPSIQEALKPFSTILQSMEEQIPTLDSEIARQLLDLSLLLAQQMTCRAVQFNPEMILGVLDEAVHALPREARGWLQIYVNPLDAETVRSAIHLYVHDHDHEHRVVEDPEILRGGCRLITRMGELDATLQGRWKTLLRNLDREDDWLSLPEAKGV